MSASERPPILIVDDDPNDLLALQLALEPLGYPLLTADSGSAAVAALLGRDASLVITDLLMHGLNGLETACAIRRLSRHSETPVLILSGLDEENARKMPGWPGPPVDYLQKPATFETLERHITALLGAASP